MEPKQLDRGRGDAVDVNGSNGTDSRSVGTDDDVVDDETDAAKLYINTITATMTHTTDNVWTGVIMDVAVICWSKVQCVYARV